MLDQIARHGLVDLDIDAKGDLHIDGHHTVEDVGITLGQAVARAVGRQEGPAPLRPCVHPARRGAVACRGRLLGPPRLHMRVDFRSSMVGALDTQLVYEFFHGFANPRGRHAAHRQPARRETRTTSARTIFKAFGRALRMAVEIDPRAAGIVPSTKGSL
jgi:imidazoleglycerol-phosphate dehydratase